MFINRLTFLKVVQILTINWLLNWGNFVSLDTKWDLSRVYSFSCLVQQNKVFRQRKRKSYQAKDTDGVGMVCCDTYLMATKLRN